MVAHSSAGLWACCVGLQLLQLVTITESRGVGHAKATTHEIDDSQLQKSVAALLEEQPGEAQTIEGVVWPRTIKDQNGKKTIDCNCCCYPDRPGADLPCSRLIVPEVAPTAPGDTIPESWTDLQRNTLGAGNPDEELEAYNARFIALMEKGPKKPSQTHRESPINQKQAYMAYTQGLRQGERGEIPIILPKDAVELTTCGQWVDDNGAGGKVMTPQSYFQSSSPTSRMKEECERLRLVGRAEHMVIDSNSEHLYREMGPMCGY